MAGQSGDRKAPMLGFEAPSLEQAWVMGITQVYGPKPNRPGEHKDGIDKKKKHLFFFVFA